MVSEYYVKHMNLDFGDVYDAIRKNNMAEGLLRARDILIKHHCMQPLIKNVKNEFTSNAYRKKGNAAYERGEFQEALVLYNQALLFAPKLSRAMKLAYSNRSALLFKTKHYYACCKDIDTCVAMGCPPEVIDKLRKRKEEAFGYALNEKIAKSNRNSLLVEKIMKPQTSNPDIPCASIDLKVVIESDGPKIVAAKDIDVGTILALETPFVSNTHANNNFVSCYYCHKMHPNLIPCDGCCYALFCDETCQQKCIQENHNYICPIIDIFNTKNSQFVLAISALVKLRQTKSWKDIIAIGKALDGLLSNGDSDIANLISKDNKHFVVGIFFTHCIENAVVMHYLDTETDFFPRSDARTKEIHAASNIIMNVSMYATTIMLFSSATMNCVKNWEYQIIHHKLANYGLYSFIGKLKRSCLSNTNTVALHRNVALVSVTPIKKDTEITIAHMSRFWFEDDLWSHRRPINMYILENTICTCNICCGNWNRQTLSKTQAKIYSELNVATFNFKSKLKNVLYMYKKVCETMEALSDAPYSEEYKTVYTIFKQFMLYFQSTVASNSLVYLSD